VAEVLRKIPALLMCIPNRSRARPISTSGGPRGGGALRHHGGAIQDVIETAIGETNLTLTIEGRQRFPVRVRYAPEYRASAEALASVIVTGPSGTQVPLDRSRRSIRSAAPP